MAWSGVAAASFTLYAATASRGVQWQDSSHFMYRIATGDLLGQLGLALTHPLHHWIGRLAVAIGGRDPYTITLVSALFGALAIANVYGCVLRLTDDARPAFFAAVSLAVANTFWRMSTLVEVYTLGAALLAAMCWCLAVYARSGSRRAFWAVFFFNGLGVANDLQASLSIPVLAAFAIHELWRARVTWLDGVTAAALWLVGALPFVALVLAQLVRSGDLVETLHSAFFGKLWGDRVLAAGFSPRMLLVDVGYPLLNFPNLLLPAALYGLFRSDAAGVQRVVRWTFVGILIFQAAFALRYDVVDQYTFFLPTYVMLAIFGGIGAALALRRLGSRHWLIATAVALLALTPFAYATAAKLARHYDVLARFERNKPYRDDYVYLILPWTVVDSSADEMSAKVLSLTGPDGRIVIEDWMGHFAVIYRALLDGMPIPKSIWWQEPSTDAFIRDAIAEGRPVVLIPFDRDRPRFAPPVGHWRRDGDVYVLER